MRIVPIFAPRLFAFHYPQEPLNALDTVLDNWSDMNYLNTFVETHIAYFPPAQSMASLVTKLANDAGDLDDIIFKLSTDSALSLDTFFKPLYNSEYRMVQLSLQKGRLNYLRLYAIKVDSNCFVVTGGAIKPFQTMQEDEETQKQLQQLKTCKSFLQQQGVFDEASFTDFQND